MGRPRDPRIDAAILSATAELLVQIGYSNLTLAAVAERAGTTKSALYRRWSSKAELVHEAAFPAAPTALAAPAGDIAADIRAMIAATRDVFTSPVVRAALPGLVADMTADAELNARVMSRFADLFAAVRGRLTEAVDRGEAHPDVDPDRLIELIGGATMLALLLRPDEPLGEEWVQQTAAIVVHGVTVASGR
ncbi:TetR family transcriptional regulator [Mycobacterium botniense]|uniref:TetR family transcriptional regulator n=1 Tax=Mycobacterium botniense TaxID=84962 RepID=A0A7I9XS57_9MYCO|nr:TetR family transcriptional regulator [Mycobacterium botniense]